MRPADRGTKHRHVAGVVEHAILLFVRCVVFFIDDDQTKIAERQEQGRARTDNQLRTALRHHFPDAAAFCDGHARMPFGGFGAEACIDAGDKFRRECDFRQEDQRLTALGQTFGHRFEIDLGLTGPGDALEQGRAIGPRGDCGAEGGRGGCLIVCQGFPGMVWVERWEWCVTRTVFFAHRPLFHETFDDRGGHASCLGQFLEGE